MTPLLSAPRSAIRLPAIVLLAIALAAPARAIEHVRVLWMDDPATEAVVSWTTRSAGGSHRVHYDDAPRGGDPAAYTHAAGPFKSGRFTMVESDNGRVEPGWHHHVHLKGLAPGKAHFLTITSDGETSREFHFITALADDRPFTLLFGGDSRIDGDEPYEHNDRRRMNERIAALVEANPTILALVHGGDYCQRAEWRYLDAWLSDHERTTTRAGRLLPVVPARGNHDVQVGFEEMFAWPERERNYYYTIAFSQAAAAVVLNTEISLAGDQRSWLERELPGARRDHRWLLAVYHQPAYPSVRSVQEGAPRRDNWVPLFEKHHVDLVCESHDHALKRTLPIRNNEPDMENGIVYIGDGGLGVPQRDPDPGRWWFRRGGFTKPAHHVHMLEFGRDALRVRAFGMEGETLDDFRVQPRSSR